jgi:hypothetical protein
MNMPCYRAYPVSNNHQVAPAPSVAITCENEQDGLRQAQKLVDDFDIELWDGPRFIARLKPLQERKGHITNESI